ncbi:MAG TPA: nucleotidyl transferase AbiEii/AbiGii toxin family protein [Planctomycetota bacterium]|nr:nucleotidyl transferase AbiEii/AbiGii toxin family protein [Planctomycetota bacterium]
MTPGGGEASAESIRHRLRNAVRARGHDVQFALQRYAAERWLYRLARSPHRDRFILKGAMLFEIWGGSLYRPTRDLDFTAYGSDDTADLLAALRDICIVPVEDDGLIFDANTLSAEPIRDQAEYRGLRVRFEARMGASRVPMQIDLGFGNAIQPPPQEVEYPTLLDTPPPVIRAYPKEAVVAEKLHAMVVLGERNSRLKDFYDLYVLASSFAFDGPTLACAIRATFERRDTAIELQTPTALTDRFFEDVARGSHWRGYLDRNRLSDAPGSFEQVGAVLIGYLEPARGSVAQGTPFPAHWEPGGPWH